jgi:hypothetical protein
LQNPKERNNLVEPDIRGKIKLKQIHLTKVKNMKINFWISQNASNFLGNFAATNLSQLILFSKIVRFLLSLLLVLHFYFLLILCSNEPRSFRQSQLRSNTLIKNHSYQEFPLFHIVQTVSGNRGSFIGDKATRA